MNKWFFVFLILVGCKNSNEPVEDINWDKLSYKNTDKFIPNSYVFSSTPVFSNNLWYYVDVSKNSLIVLNKAFDFYKSIEIIGESPKKLKRYSDINLVNDYLFITGLTDLIIYNTKNGSHNYYKHNLGSFDLPCFFNGNYIVGHYDYKKNTYCISTFEFDNTRLFNIKHKLNIPYEEGTDSSEYSGWL